MFVPKVMILRKIVRKIRTKGKGKNKSKETLKKNASFRNSFFSSLYHLKLQYSVRFIVANISSRKKQCKVLEICLFCDSGNMGTTQIEEILTFSLLKKSKMLHLLLPIPKQLSTTVCMVLNARVNEDEEAQRSMGLIY